MKVQETPFRVQLTVELSIHVVNEILRKLFKEKKPRSEEDSFEALHLGPRKVGKGIFIMNCENATRKGDANYCSSFKRECMPVTADLPTNCPCIPTIMIQQIRKEAKYREEAASKVVEEQHRGFQ